MGMCTGELVSELLLAAPSPIAEGRPTVGGGLGIPPPPDVPAGGTGTT
jgi:hypothetical protein